MGEGGTVINSEREAPERVDLRLDAASPFLFLGGTLALDFVNTEYNTTRGVSHDSLMRPDDVARWWEEIRTRYADLPVVQGEDGMLAAPVFDAALLAAFRRLRAALHALFLSLINGTLPAAEDVAALNMALALGHRALDPAGGALRVVYRSDQPAAAALLLPVALSALNVLTERDPRRLRQCDNDRCVVLFYDATKSATRRWCSLSCMDRARARQRYRKSRQRA